MGGSLVLKRIGSDWALVESTAPTRASARGCG
jgi:hypothetical protein